MQIEVFSLCNAATVENGKLNMLGAFDRITAKKIPAVHPQCAVAMRIRFNSVEGNEHKVSVKFVDADGKHIVPSVQGSIKMQFPDKQRSGSANLVLNVQGLKLTKYGEYSIDLSVDGKSVASVPFFLQQRK